MKSSAVVRLESRSVKSLTERFSRLVGSGERRGELEKTLFHLKSERLRNAASAKTFVEHGGLQASLALSRKLAPETKSDAKLLALLWGTMANLCSLDRQARIKIAELGTAELCKLLSETSCPNVINTVSRTIGNIASGGSASILFGGKTQSIVRDLTHILQTCQDSFCLQSVIRTVKMLNKDHEVRDELRMCESLLAVMGCLKHEEKLVKNAVLDTLESFVISSEPELLQTLWLPAGIEGLSLVCAHAFDSGMDDMPCKVQAVNVLVECSKHYEGKAALSRAGGIEALVQFFSTTDDKSETRDSVVRALCACCRDVHGRQKLRDSGGLLLLITVLRDGDSAAHHDDILSALVCYYFDENTLRYMVRMLGLMRSLVFHLQRMVHDETEYSMDVARDSDGYGAAGGDPIVDVSTPNSFALEMAEIGSDIGVAECASMDEAHWSEVPSPSQPIILDSEELLGSPVSRPASAMSASPGRPRSNRESSRSISPEPQAIETLASATTNSPSESKPKANPAELSASALEPLELVVVTPSPPIPAEDRAGLFDLGISPSFSPELSSIASSHTNASPHRWSPSSMSSEESSDQLEVIKEKEDNTVSSLTHQATSARQATTPASIPRAIVTVDLESSTPMPANFIDSLLSSPNYYEHKQPSKQEVANPFHEGNSTTGTKVLFLLSRISHLRDCQPILASPEVLPAILNYFYATSPPDMHCFKVMSRIFANPHCFQDCVSNLAPSRVFMHINRALDHEASSTVTKTETQTAFLYSPTSSSQTPSSWSPCGFLPSPLGADATGHTLTPPIEDLSWQLFEKLARVAESPYGQGVVAHALLRGDLAQVQASSLALALLYRSHSVCLKMLTSYGGLRNLCLMAQGLSVDRESATAPGDCETRGVTETDADLEAVCLQPMAISALLFLVYHCSQQGSHRKRSRTFTLEDALGSFPPSKLSRRDSQPQHGHTSPDGICHAAAGHFPVVAAATPPPCAQPCRYVDTDHCPFDLTLSVEGGRYRFPVHKRVLMESSEVFSVMLSGQYQESSQDDIQIQQVPVGALEALLHHMYGCPQNCRSENLAVPWSWSRACSYLERRHLAASPGGECRQTLDEEMPVDELVKGIVDPLSLPEHSSVVLETLQTLICADQFFVPSLVSQCEQKLSRHITSDNLMPMFLFSQIHQSHLLARQCVWCLVTLPQTSKQVEVFKEVLYSPERKSFLEIVQSYFFHSH